MSHIKLKKPIPGIVGLFTEFPETGAAMSQMAETILRKDGPLPTWFREFIASGVSRENNTQFCGRSHMATAVAISGRTKAEMYDIVANSPKYRGLWAIAQVVVYNGLTKGLIEEMQAAGTATDEEIHDTVAIAAAFCMYNRYVQCLGEDKPLLSKEDYTAIGTHLAIKGYMSKEPIENMNVMAEGEKW